MLKTLLGDQFLPPEIGSITGASAGGINTLLSGLTWCSLAELNKGAKDDPYPLT